MKRVIVTGANGFIGAALCKELSINGVEVLAVVRNEESKVSHIQQLPNLRIIYSDLANMGNLAEIIKEREIDVLYHLAWAGSAGALRGNSDVQLKNVKYTCDTVKACSHLGCKRIVFASSIMEYEIQALMATQTVPGINTLYCSAKIAADYMARTLAGSYGIDYISAVISNIYGPGEWSPRLINTSLRKLLTGEHCSFSAGEQTYDFIYITDAAKAFMAIGEKGLSNKSYYIGSLNPKPLKHFLCEMRNQVNPDVQIGLGELPFTGVALTYDEFDLNAVKKDTGFVPKVPFAEGIQKTIAWLKEV